LPKKPPITELRIFEAQWGSQAGVGKLRACLFIGMGALHCNDANFQKTKVVWALGLP
jgi:hypothetical protein